MRKRHKIIILRLEHIGDYVLSMDSIASIKNFYPNSQIDLVVGPWNKQLAESSPFVDNVLIYKDPFGIRNSGYFSALKVLFLKFFTCLSFIKKMNKNNYDILFNFSERKYSRIYSYFISAKKKILCGPRNDSISEKKRIDDVITSNGIKLISPTNKIKFSNYDISKIKKIIKNPGIIIHPISPLCEKNWQIGKWKDLIKNLIFKKKYPIYIIGTRDEKTQIEYLRDSFDEKEKKHIFNLCGKLNLVQTILAIDKNKLFIGIDSGPMHLAELTGTPIVAIFGPTNEKKWGPHRRSDKLIKKECINKISPEEVLKLI